MRFGSATLSARRSTACAGAGVGASALDPDRDLFTSRPGDAAGGSTPGEMAASVERSIRRTRSNPEHVIDSTTGHFPAGKPARQDRWPPNPGEPLAGRRGASGAEAVLPCDRQHGQSRVTGERRPRRGSGVQ
jgi:hypothetical protein